MRYKAVISIIVAIIVASIIPTIDIHAGNVTWNYSNDVLVSNANEDKQQRESHIAVSPTNNNYLVVALMDNTPDPNTSDRDYISKWRAYNSTDGGNTWTNRGFLSLPSGMDRSNDPVVASTADGNFFIACIAGNITSTPYVLYWRSSGSGATWSNYNIIKHTGTSADVDKPWIAADVKDTNSPYKNNVYACWREEVGRSNWIKFKRIYPTMMSEDKTIDSPPTNQNDTTPLRNFCHIAVGKNGIIYVVWARFDNVLNSTDYIMMSRSFDGGVSWSSPQQIASFTYVSSVSSYDILVQIFVNPQIAIDNDWNLHLVYVTKTSAGDTEIRYRKITNCTSTQSCNLQPLVNISNNSRDQWEPAITVSRSNIVHVTALDKRDAANNNSWWRLYHYHCHLSTSACTSSSDWYYVRVTNEGTYVYSSGKHINFIGHYHGIASSIASTNAREAYTIWTDSTITTKTIIYSMIDYHRVTE